MPTEISKELKKKISCFAPQAELMPSVVLVQQLEPFSTIYMSERGLKELGITQRELWNIGPDYLKRFFNIEDSEDYLLKLKNLITNNDSEDAFTFFQQVRIEEQKEWVWHIGSTRIFFHDKEGRPSHIVTIAIPINKLKHIPNKAERLLAEKDFFNANVEKFSTLGKREREVLSLVARGRSSLCISKELFISVQTVNSHRKSIKRKLKISSSYEFTLYAHAFDLM